MASSSVSQESLDREDSVDISARRSRVRVNRGSRIASQRGETTTEEQRGEAECDERCHRTPGWGPHRTAAVVTGAVISNPPSVTLPGHINFCPTTGDHESPNRLRIKDKRNWQPGYIHKGKPPQPPGKDKRKLREKRRSSGVMHAQSAESTGDSLDETDTDPSATNVAAQKCPPAHSEVIDADNPQTPEEDRKAYGARKLRSKSPSDLEADFEDNQDYDSTVSQSETKLPTFTPSAAVGRLPEVEGTSDEGVANMRSAATDAAELRRLLAEERRKNRLLRDTLEGRERIIADLERKVDELMQAAARP